MPVDGRRPGRALDHDGAGVAEEPGEAGAGGDRHDPAAARAARPACAAASTCSAKWVTRTRCGRPAAMPASIAAPTSSTWTWTFHSPSPPTTTSESPSGREVALEPLDRGRVVGVEEVHHLVGRAVGHQVVGLRRRGGDGDGAGADRGQAWRSGDGRSARPRRRRGRRTAPARRRRRRRPRGADRSCSGVWASASRAASAAAVKTSRARARGSSARRTAASAAARATVRIVPSTGVPTAA